MSEQKTVATLIIHVLQADINNGLRGSCSTRPIALAVARTFPEDTVFVSYGTIVANHTEYRTPKEVRQFIVDFDNDRPVTPFEFELPIEEAA